MEIDWFFFQKKVKLIEKVSKGWCRGVGDVLKLIEDSHRRPFISLGRSILSINDLYIDN